MYTKIRNKKIPNANKIIEIQKNKIVLDAHCIVPKVNLKASRAQMNGLGFFVCWPRVYVIFN
jgi:hypothetical protein